MLVKKYNFILVSIIFICIVLLGIQNFTQITGHISETTTPSNVSIQKYLAISFSDDLASGISFGDVSVLPAININSTNNYGGVNNSTTLYINISDDGNTAVDFCIKASNGLTNEALDVITLDKESYAGSEISNLTNPSLINETSLTTSYAKSGEGFSSGSQNYYRFWLDIPAAQPSGNYNNSISFKGIQSGASC